MKIAKTDIFLLNTPIGGNLFNPRLLWHRKQSVLLRIADADGFEGWGESWCFDSSADVLVRYLQTEILPDLKDRVFENPSDICVEFWAQTSLTGRHGMMSAALSAVDVALHDLISKRENQPLGETISKSLPRASVPVYASGGLYRTEDSLPRLHAEMSEYITAGHDRVKVKFGALPFEEDMARMHCVRDAIGPDAGLLVDAVYSLDRTRAEAWLPVWQDLKIEAVQAPFPVNDWDSMTWLNHECGMPVMVYEAESRYEIFRALLERRAIGILQFSPVAVGGTQAARRLIDLAESCAIPVSLQCSSTWLAESIALELARGHLQIAHVELHTLHRGLFNNVPDDETCPVNGHLLLHNRPGLGFAPQLQMLNRMTTDLPDFQNDFLTTNQQIAGRAVK